MQLEWNTKNYFLKAKIFVLSSKFEALGNDLIDYICDTTSEKIGKFSPGAHIPVVSMDHFKKNIPGFWKQKDPKKKHWKFVWFFNKKKWSN